MAGFFGLERVGAYSYDDDDDAVANRHTWYMLPAFAYIAPPFSGIPEDAFAGASALFMLVYLFFTTKVLTSLIMAIFATAHTRVFRDAEIEYVYESHYALFEHRHVLLHLPPPLNLPFFAYRIVMVSLLAIVRRLTGTGDPAPSEAVPVVDPTAPMKAHPPSLCLKSPEQSPERPVEEPSRTIERAPHHES